MKTELFRMLVPLTEATPATIVPEPPRPAGPGPDERDEEAQRKEKLEHFRNLQSGKRLKRVLRVFGRAVEVDVPHFGALPSLERRSSRAARGVAIKVHGKSPYYVAEETLLGYELGEISFVNPAMQGELRERVYSDERTVETTTETETVVEEEESKTLDIKTEEAFLKEVENQVQTEIRASAELGVSADYGVVKTGLVASASGQIARNLADKTVEEFTRKVTDKTITTLKRSERTLRRVSETLVTKETLTHRIEPQDKHINGVYRRLNRRIKVEVREIGAREVLEFVLPKPGAPLLHRTYPDSVEAPEPFDLTIRDVASRTSPRREEFMKNYMEWANRYGARDISVLPDRFLMPSSVFNLNPTREDPDAYRKGTGQGETAVQIPPGYEAKRIQISVVFSNIEEEGQDQKKFRENLFLSIGSETLSITNRKYLAPANNSTDFISTSDGFNISQNDIQIGNWSVFPLEHRKADGSIEPRAAVVIVAGLIDARIRSLTSDHVLPMTEKVPVAIATQALGPLSVSVLVEVERTASLEDEWVADTFRKINLAYRERMSEYEIARRASGTDTSDRMPEELEDRSSAAVRKLIHAELKRECLRLLGGDTLFAPAGLRLRNSFPDLDMMQLEQLQQFGDAFRTFEAIFEWENMSYTLGEYFWSDDDWVGGRALSSDGSEVAEFLAAGSARVFVPVREAYERLVREEVSKPEPFRNVTVDPELMTDDVPRGEPVGRLTACIERQVPTDLVVINTSEMDFPDMLDKASPCGEK